MSRNDDLEPLLRNFARLPREEQDLVRQRVIERARAMRAELFRSLIRRLYSWFKRRAAIAQLRSLDDRMLKDMGISRGEIEAAVRGRHGDLGRSAPVRCGAPDVPSKHGGPLAA